MLRHYVLQAILCSRYGVLIDATCRVLKPCGHTQTWTRERTFFVAIDTTNAHSHLIIVFSHLDGLFDDDECLRGKKHAYSVILCSIWSRAFLRAYVCGPFRIACDVCMCHVSRVFVRPPCGRCGRCGGRKVVAFIITKMCVFRLQSDKRVWPVRTRTDCPLLWPAQWPLERSSSFGCCQFFHIRWKKTVQSSRGVNGKTTGFAMNILSPLVVCSYVGLFVLCHRAALFAHNNAVFAAVLRMKMTVLRMKR